MSTITIIGANGGMGRRYQAILAFLGYEVAPIEVDHEEFYIKKCIERSDGVIIATPTDTHAAIVRKTLKYRKPILCEKPICKDTTELNNLFTEIKESKTPFRMVFQYSLLCGTARIGRSNYNYFRHGNDGIYWDCLQIIGLARSGISLEETSPVWRCTINGQVLKIADMDSAYIGDVQRWMRNPNLDLSFLKEIHEKTASLERDGKNGN